MQPLEQLHPESLVRHAATIRSLLRSRLWAQVLVAMALGIGVGLVLGPSNGLVSETAAQNIGNWLALPGRIFLAAVQMIVVPLVFSSIILGLAAGENLQQLRRMGLATAVYFTLTTAVALVIGISLTLLIRPGERGDFRALVSQTETVSEGDYTPGLHLIPEAVSSLIPDNPLGSMVEKEMFQVVIFSIIFGIALINLKPNRSRPLLDLFAGIQDVCLLIVRWAMILAPLAVFGLLAQVIMGAGPGLLMGLSAYVMTVLAALSLHILFYLFLIRTFGGMSIGKFLRAAREPQLLAFSTSSSAPVMPLSIQTAETKLDVKSSVSHFVVPLGATINMDGTAVYQAVATLFLAQVFGINLGLGGLLLIVVTAVGTSIGAPATPGVGIVLLAVVLRSVGVPLSGIALILGVDRLLDMSRTVVNVTGDLTACVLINRWMGRGKNNPSPAAVPE